MRQHLMSTVSTPAMRAERDSLEHFKRKKTDKARIGPDGYLEDITEPPRLVPRGWGVAELRRLAEAKAS